MKKQMLCVLVALPPNPWDLSHSGQRQVAHAGRETLDLHTHCTCLRRRLGAVMILLGGCFPELPDP